MGHLERYSRKMDQLGRLSCKMGQLERPSPEDSSVPFGRSFPASQLRRLIGIKYQHQHLPGITPWDRLHKVPALSTKNAWIHA